MENQRTIQMTTNFEGLIHLLADGLYSTSDIFVRELIQNGHDGIIRRQAEMNDPGFQGSISVDFDRASRTITFTDNGIGMNEEEIEKFLSVIGSTGTGTQREELEQRFSDELIGQFGIGLLSSFLVAEKVDVLTRRLNSDKAFLWSNSGSTECILRYDVTRPDTGSAVTVYLRPEFNYLLDRAKLEEIIVRYCDFITVPIRINGGEHVNAIYAPWDKHYNSKEQEIDSYEEFVNRRFPDMSMDVFPVKIDAEAAGKSVQARGVLYISNRRLAGLNSTGVADIFVRKMLVKEGDASLLPTWAKFVRGVIDSPDLRPTAGRDNVNQEDPAFKAIQTALGDVIVDRLAYLAEHRPDKFAYINQWHHDNLKGMAMVNDEFFDRAADLLLFETNYEKNDGLLSLRQYLSKNPLLEDGRVPIYYFAYYDSAAQYYRMAAEKGLTVINAGRNFDEELLEKYGKKYPETVALEKLDVLDKGVFFEELAEDEREKYRPIERALTESLTTARRNLVVTTKRFTPVEIPAVIIESEVEKTDRELEALLSAPKMRENFGDIFSSVRRRIRERPIQLALNANSYLIELLSKYGDKLAREEAGSVLTTLYNNALLYSHRLDEKNRSLVHDGVTALMIRLLQLMDEKAALHSQLEQERAASIQRKQENSTRDAQKPDYIRLFMMTPFAESYKPVEDALRKVFEQKPFWFEVRLARDYYDAGTLVKNVQTQIASSHGFLAEISELSPNVMMEAGAVLMSGDKRPMFVIRAKDGKKPPVDFGDLLTFSYASREAGADAIAEEIKKQIFTDGRLSNADFRKLCAERDENGMKRFLSRALLESLSANYIQLKSADIEKICKAYATVEAFLEADDAALSALKTNAPMFLLKGAQEELRKQTQEESHGG